MTTNNINFNTTSVVEVATRLPQLSRIKGILNASFLVATMVLVSNYASANTANNATKEVNQLSTRSIAVDYNGHPQKLSQSKFNKQKNDAQQAAQQAIDLLVDDLSQAASERKTRDEVIAIRNSKFDTKSQAINKGKYSISTQNSLYGEYVEFDIYTASTVLFDDYDYDGFYQTFSVTFDADVYGPYEGQRARVFADLYLSRDGGPWELYFTTDAFTILDDSSEDEFEVFTSLDAGYRTEHYDVLIDIYEVGFSDIVATVSSEEFDSLYALPLESADRDVYEEVVSTSVGISAGSQSFASLFLLGSIVLMRLFSCFEKSYRLP